MGAGCTSLLRLSHTIYSFVSLWITFWQGFVPPCRKGVIAVEILPKTRFSRFGYNAVTGSNVIFSKIWCTRKEVFIGYGNSTIEMAWLTILHCIAWILTRLIARPILSSCFAFVQLGTRSFDLLSSLQLSGDELRSHLHKISGKILS